MRLIIRQLIEELQKVVVYDDVNDKKLKIHSVEWDVFSKSEKEVAVILIQFNNGLE